MPMLDLSKNVLVYVRLFSGILALLAVFFVMPGRGSYSPSAVPQRTFPAGCGTVEGSFEGGPCILLSFRGEVSANQAFQRKFGDGLLFRLVPKGEQFGWDIEVVPDRPGDTSQSEYIWVVTPPYHFWNPRYLDASYGMSASEAVRSSPRNFNFVLNEEQYKKAADLVALAVTSHPQSDKRSAEEFEKESQDAAKALFKFPVAKGRLIILKSRIGTSDESGKQSFIKWLEFRVDLRVPCDFSAIGGSAEISIDHSKCSAERSEKGE
jgi:hypothetical protein